jgi:hypothetical protein
LFYRDKPKKGSNMKTWKQCCEEVGYNPYESNPPERITKYYAYKNGAVFHVKTLEEAKGISKTYENVVCNQDEIDDYWNSRRDLENKAQVIWYNSLLEEYSYLPGVEMCSKNQWLPLCPILYSKTMKVSLQCI